MANVSNSDIDFNSKQLETSLTESQKVSSGLGDLKTAVRNAYSDSTVTSMGYKSPLKTVETMEEDVDGVTKAIRYITSLLTGALDVAHDQFEQAAQSEPTVTPVYDSFHGVQNQPAYDLVTGAINDKLKGLFNDKVSDAVFGKGDKNKISKFNKAHGAKYNDADQAIGDNVNYILVDLLADLDTDE